MEVTESKLKANRSNAQKSTGPRTQRGKTIASKNPLKHGLLSQGPCLPHEDLNAFQELATSFKEHFKPVGALEEFLLNKLITQAWRLRRLAEVENGIFNHEIIENQIEESQKELSSYREELFQAQSFTIITNQARHDAIERRIDGLAAQYIGPGIAFIRDGRGADIFSKLARYENHINRSFYQALHELERAQSNRLGHTIPLSIPTEMHMNPLA